MGTSLEKEPVVRGPTLIFSFWESSKRSTDCPMLNYNFCYFQGSKRVESERIEVKQTQRETEEKRKERCSRQKMEERSYEKATLSTFDRNRENTSVFKLEDSVTKRTQIQ